MKKSGTDIFRFKEFHVSHHRSSMKVGVDGVLIGAWGAVESGRGIDVGTGCGLIALMAAQRNESCHVDAIDIDRASVEEAAVNFEESGWGKRLKAIHADIWKYAEDHKETYEFILSNPPYFHAGVTPESRREKARHLGSLSPAALLEIGGMMLKVEGKLSMIFPYEDLERLEEEAVAFGLSVEKICAVADKPGKSPKRAMIMARKGARAEDPEMERLDIRNETGEYSQEYKRLTSEFYLDI